MKINNINKGSMKAKPINTARQLQEKNSNIILERMK